MRERSLPLPGGRWKLQRIRLHHAWGGPNGEAHHGRQVVGMDPHRRRSVLVRMTEDGWRRGTARITGSAQELRERTRSRQKLVRLRISCKDEVRAVLAKLGVPVTLHVDLVLSRLHDLEAADLHSPGHAGHFMIIHALDQKPGL